jgi:large subunit ribosomal protein L24e
MAKCSFCGGKTPDARGKMFVRNDGKIFYFCNSKCHSNWKLHREGKNVKWTHTFQKESKKPAVRTEKNAE